MLLNQDNLGHVYAAFSDRLLHIVPKMANRHGMIAGATGTGKTVSLQVLAEAFSEMGVPVFMADMKGDLTGIAKEGKRSSFIEKREAQFGLQFGFQSFPVEILDVFGDQGLQLRTNIDSLGVSLLSRILELNETQSGVLTIAFRVAKEKGWQLDDVSDLRAMLIYITDNAKELNTIYGNVSAASVGAIQRALLRLEEQGGDKFIGTPAFNPMDFIRCVNGKGVVNILAADKLANSPLLYSTFLFWMLSSLYDQLPEIGDADKPKLIFFFDEAHMLFDGASKAVLDKVEQVVRLIRSKGVGVYFITQNPTDIPDGVLSQLGNKIQHALRAYTPKDQKAVKSVAQGFRANPAFDTETVIKELETGEALISFLDEKGSPMMVERAKMLSPAGRIGPLTDEERKEIINNSELGLKLRNSVSKDTNKASVAAASASNEAEAQRIAEKEREEAEKQAEKDRRQAEKEAEKAEKAAKAELERKEKQAEKEREKRNKSIWNAITKLFPKLIELFFGRRKYRYSSGNRKNKKRLW